VERDAERALEALRAMAIYLAGRAAAPAAGTVTPSAVLTAEAAAAAERVLAYLHSLRGAGRDPSGLHPVRPGSAGDRCVRGVEEFSRRTTSARWPGRGDPGE
jgi:hypothetical protein